MPVQKNISIDPYNPKNSKGSCNKRHWSQMSENSPATNRQLGVRNVPVNSCCERTSFVSWSSILFDKFDEQLLRPTKSSSIVIKFSSLDICGGKKIFLSFKYLACSTNFTSGYPIQNLKDATQSNNGPTCLSLSNSWKTFPLINCLFRVMAVSRFFEIWHLWSIIVVAWLVLTNWWGKLVLKDCSWGQRNVQPSGLVSSTFHTLCCLFWT